MNFFNELDKYDSNACLIDENNKVFSYKDVLDISKKTSKYLKERSLIFVLAQNHIEFVTSYVGFFAKGLVQILIDPKIEVNLFKNLTE